MFSEETFPKWDWNRAVFPDRHVLVCEDHLGQQIRAATLLGELFGLDQRVQVSLVPGARQAAAVLSATKVHAVFLDHDMPDGNGQSLLNWMVSSGFSDVPVFTFSGISENNFRMRNASASLFRIFHVFTKEEVLTGLANHLVREVLA